MPRIAIVDKSNNKQVGFYEGPADQSKFGGPWGDPDLFDHVAKVETTETRGAKLSDLRAKRDIKLCCEVDVMINELQLGIRTDTTAVKDYRQSLLDITNDYKNHATDTTHKTNIDAKADDWSDLTWPTAP